MYSLYMYIQCIYMYMYIVVAVPKQDSMSQLVTSFVLLHTAHTCLLLSNFQQISCSAPIYRGFAHACLILSCLGALQLLCTVCTYMTTTSPLCVHSREGLSVCRGGWCSLSCERSGRTRGRRSARPHAHRLSPAYSYPPESRTDKSSCVDPVSPGGVWGEDTHK